MGSDCPICPALRYTKQHGSSRREGEPIMDKNCIQQSQLSQLPPSTSTCLYIVLFQICREYKRELKEGNRQEKSKYYYRLLVKKIQSFQHSMDYSNADFIRSLFFFGNSERNMKREGSSPVHVDGLEIDWIVLSAHFDNRNRSLFKSRRGAICYITNHVD